MKIGRKLSLTFLLLSFISLLLSTAIGLYQLVITRNDIHSAYSAQTEDLISSNIEMMTAFNADMVSAIAQNYAENIEGNFRGVSRQVQALTNQLQWAYAGGSESFSRFPDNIPHLQPGVSLADIQDEFLVTRSLRDLFADIMAADPDLWLYYASESGFILYGEEVDYAFGADIDRRERDWYTGAMQSGGLRWTPLYADARTGMLTITCSMPVIDGRGEIMGVVACDIFVEPLVDEVLAVQSDVIAFTFLMDEAGDDFIGSLHDKTLADFMPPNQREAFIGQMLENTEALGLYIDGDILAGYALIPETGWTVGVLLDQDMVLAPSRYIDESMHSSIGVFNSYIDERIWSAIAISVVAALLLLAAALFISKKVTRSITEPLQILTESAGKISGGDLQYDSAINSGDELETLSETFASMTHRLREYIDNLATVTAENERISTELNIATQIQADMLPNIFPAFPEREEFEIYASMQPAKEVGGDFYDFFLIDADHLCMVIADVSGKGVPAALFMVIAKTLINNHARTGDKLQELCANVNAQLCEGNETVMFVSAWMAVLEISTGIMTYVNAGHNPPLYKKSGGSYEYLKTKRGFVLGGIKSLTYTQLELQLNKGDMLYLYTDGVTEANNAADELYGEGRLQAALNRAAGLSPTELLPHIKQELDVFVDSAPQFDDITMLALRIN